MEFLQCRDKILDASDPVPLATQPADEFEAQLRGEATEVAKAHLLQEVAGVAPQHHVNIHVLCTLRFPPDRNRHRKEGRKEGEKERESGKI